MINLNDNLKIQFKSKNQEKSSIFFFCVGTQKSGTTLLARVLDQHPYIACICESYILKPKSQSSIVNPESNSWAKYGFSKSDVQRWHKTMIAKPDLWSRLQRKLIGKNDFLSLNFENVVREIFEDFSAKCNARVVGDKWPWYIDNINVLLKAFPNAKIIYNVRDPRGIWYSAQKFKGRGRGDEILQEMLSKDRKIAPYLSQENFLTIRYEDLVVDPHKTCKRLYQFLECDFSEEYLNYSLDKDPLPKRWNWIPETSDNFNPYHTKKWKDKMTKEEIDQVNKISQVFIEKYNYTC